jgi:hypothetical protein
MLVLNAFIILLLGLILYQDIKSRTIHFSLLIALTALFILYGLLNLPFVIYFKRCAFNLIFLSIQIILLTAYYYLKGKSFGSIINVMIGTGDIVLLIALVFAFSKINFVVFYLTGMIFSLLLWLLISFFSSQKKRLVPLAGLLSLYMILIVLGDALYQNFERLNDNFLIRLIYG